MAALLAMISLIAGLAIVFGHKVSKSLMKVCLFVLLLPVIINFAFAPVIAAYDALPLIIQVICWIISPFILLLLLRALLPNSAWLRVLSRVLLELAVFVTTFPFRFLWRSFRLVTDREHHSMNLARHFPAVGQRPPQLRQYPMDFRRR